MSVFWLVLGFARSDTIARKPDHDKARDPLEGTPPALQDLALNGAVRIAIV
jgi:hypothetical protein